MKKTILSGYWIDDLPEPFETVENADDLMRRVYALKAKREAVEKTSRNGIIQKRYKQAMQKI